MTALPLCPQPPEWQVDWTALDAAYVWLRHLRDCPQDPIHHAEGDVWIHTRMVCQELAQLEGWRSLPEEDRALLFWAALLHDVGKPDCTRHNENGRISSRGHSRRGAILARQILWRMAVPFAQREQVCNLVRYHQIPYYLLERDNPARLAIEISQNCRCDWLALLAEADIRGRICADQQRLLDNVALFVECCREEQCLHGPRAFVSDHTRFLYFRQEGRHPDVLAHDDTRVEVVVTSGLPGAGKDHWIRTHLPDWPVVSLDAVRQDLDIEPTDDQGTVVNHARELAREHLRRAESFVWNATNLSRQLRGVTLSLLASYRARIRLVYLEVPEEVLLRQNEQRSARVPRVAIERMLERWEVPDRTEAHQVEWGVRGESAK